MRSARSLGCGRLDSGGGPLPAVRLTYANDAAGLASGHGPQRRSPDRACTAGAGTRMATKIHQGATSGCHLPFWWAYASPRLARRLCPGRWCEGQVYDLELVHVLADAALESGEYPGFHRIPCVRVLR